MQRVIQTMGQLYLEIRTGGAYFILLLAALFVLYRLNKKKSSGYILYTLMIIVLVCMNPLLVYALSRAFPVLASYRFFVLLIPVLLVVPVAATELLDQIREFKRNLLLLLLIFIIIGLSGNAFGIYKGKQSSKEIITAEEQEVINCLEKIQPELIVADEELIPYIRTHSNQNLPLLYGRDLYQPDMDLGIMDGYQEELLSLYEATKNPKDTIDDILATAEIYGADTVVLRQYENAKKKAGHFSVVFETKHYLIYQSGQEN